MKILICGGHLTPALAIINKLKNDAEIIYVGRKYALEGDSALSLEYQTISDLNIKFINLNAGRIQRNISKHTISSAFKVFSGFLEAFQILQKEKPDVVMGFGSYVSLPIGIIAYLKKIPLIIHEQTFKAGLSNKILGIIASKVCISWDTSRKYFPKNKTILTGNPVLEEYFINNRHSGKQSASRIYTNGPWTSQDDKIKKIVFIGGSLGSHFINDLVSKIIDKLVLKYGVIHQTGDAKEFSDFQKLEKLKLSLINKDRYKITRFIEPSKIKNVFEDADVIISRAGVNTVSTLLVMEKPAIFIPLPFNSSDQMQNAIYFKNAGLGEVLIQNDIIPEQFLNFLDTFIKNLNEYRLRVNKDILDIHKTAADKIINIIYEYHKKISR